MREFIKCKFSSHSKCLEENFEDHGLLSHAKHGLDILIALL